MYSNILVRCAELCLETKPGNKNHKNLRKIKPSLHQAWLRLRKAFNIWKDHGKDKNHKSFYEYKIARGAFQKEYRYDNELRFIKKQQCNNFCGQEQQKAIL